MSDKKRITPKIRAGIDALVQGDAKNVTEAAAKAGLSRSHFSRQLSEPHIADHLRTRVLRNIAVAAARAGDTKVKLLDSANDLVRDRASSFILGVVGISPQTSPGAGGSALLPGLQIVIMNGEPSGRIAVEPRPLTIEHETRLIEQK